MCPSLGHPRWQPTHLASPGPCNHFIHPPIEVVDLNRSLKHLTVAIPPPGPVPPPLPLPATGFEDYDKVRKDPNLATLRKSPKFKRVIDRYDEPIINEGAIKALKSLFSFGKKSDNDEL